ncbi:MAG: Slp family lipoprotein [Proteobacteria bacterium]|nr:Slp family lipoprotein [Pseudomonadota bacterium]
MKLVVSVLVVFLSACSSLPVEIQQTPENNISLYQVIDKVAEFSGTPVRWGGKIVSIVSEGGSSTIEIEQLPVNRYGFPLQTHPSQGVFEFESNESLDPAIYQEGLLITVSGSVSSEVTKTINRIERAVPVIVNGVYHLWPYGESGGKSYTHMGVETRYTGYGYYGHGSSDNYR